MRRPRRPRRPPPVSFAVINVEGPPPALPPATAAHREQSFRKIDLDPPARTATMMSMIHVHLSFDVSKIYLSCISRKPARAILRTDFMVNGDGRPLRGSEDSHQAAAGA